VRDNGGSKVIGSEILESKARVASANLREAGLEAHADVRLGDALETLRDLPEPVHLVLLDGWKNLYVPVLEQVTPRLRPGAVVMADNIFTLRKSLRPYVEAMQPGERGFASTTLHPSDGFEYSVYLGMGRLAWVSAFNPRSTIRASSLGTPWASPDLRRRGSRGRSTLAQFSLNPVEHRLRVTDRFLILAQDPVLQKEV
jgi:hypothetical protein